MTTYLDDLRDAEATSTQTGTGLVPAGGSRAHASQLSCQLCVIQVSSYHKFCASCRTLASQHSPTVTPSRQTMLRPAMVILNEMRLIRHQTCLLTAVSGRPPRFWDTNRCVGWGVGVGRERVVKGQRQEASRRHQLSAPAMAVLQGVTAGLGVAPALCPDHSMQAWPCYAPPSSWSHGFPLCLQHMHSLSHRCCAAVLSVGWPVPDSGRPGSHRSQAQPAGLALGELTLGERLARSTGCMCRTS